MVSVWFWGWKVGIRNFVELDGEECSGILQLFNYENDSKKEDYGISIISAGRFISICLSDYDVNELELLKRHIDKAIILKNE